MSDSAKAPQDGDDAGAATKRETGQATLAAISEVSIAATDAVGGIAAALPKTRWLPIAGFLCLVYVASSFVAIYTLKSERWVQAFLTPLLPTLIATLVFWRRQAWKFRSREWRFKEKTRQEALNSLAHETANGVNAVRANLAGLREATSETAAQGHRKQLDQALARIDAALARAVRDTPSTPPASAQAGRGTTPSPAKRGA
jgi:hypothetical protein